MRNIEHHKKFFSMAYDQFVAGPPAGGYIDMADHYEQTLIVSAHGMKITSAVRCSDYGDRQVEDFVKLNWLIEPRVMTETGADAIMKLHLQVVLDNTLSTSQICKNMNHQVI